MPKLNWDGNDFRNEQSSSGTTADLVSHDGNLQQGYQHGSLTKGLVAYYPMEKGAGEVLHDGALDNLGQINGASWNESGKVGSDALSFDGTNDRAAVRNSLIDGASRFTVSAWINPTSNKVAIITGVDSGSNNSVWALETGVGSTNEVEAWIDVGGTNYFATGSTPPTGSWTHVAMTYNGNKLILYTNGSQSASNSSMNGEIRTSVSNPWIGGAQDGRNRWWDGQIDDVRVYNRPLSQPEIQALANNTKTSGVKRTEKQVPGQNQGGISRYKLNGNVNDSWGSNDGNNNSVTFVDGVYGKAADFRSSNKDSISLGQKSSLEVNTWTVAAWVNWDSKPDNYEHIYSTGYSDNDNTGWKIASNSNKNQYQLAIQNNSGLPRVESGKINTDVWEHIVGTYDSSSMYLYRNGRLLGTQSASTPDYGSNPSALGYAPERNARYFDGQIDDLRIYNTALTHRKVEKLYHKGSYRIPRESTLQ